MKSLTVDVFKYTFIFLFMLTLLNLIINNFNTNGNNIPFKNLSRSANTTSLGFIVDTTGCKIPEMLLYPDSLKKYYKTVKPMQCEDKRPPLFESNLTSIFINESALPKYGFPNKKLIKCCYMWLKRSTVGSSSNPPEESVLFQSECVFFDFNFRSPYEFIKIHCFQEKKVSEAKVLIPSKLKALRPMYTDYFYFVLPPQQIEGNVSSSNESKVNILIMGLDSTSRLNFHRQMPRTFHFLESLEAIEFLGFNKIADNTHPNVIALLTGNSFKEVRDGCFKKSLSDKIFDHCHFIWDDYKSHGYITAFIEDAVKTGLFNYKPDKKGFFKQPTDFYWNTFYNEATKGIGNRNNQMGGQAFCFGTRKIHEVMLEFAIRFTTIMDQNNQPYFAHIWQSLLCHDDINQLQNGDAAYSELLIKLNDTGLLKNTVLFFLSDHGFRFGNVRKTYQGMMEDRLPFVFVKLPDWMKQQYPHLQDILEINSKRLVTMYDIHETFRHLLNVSSLSSSSNWNYGKRRGNSLLAPIKEDRTCVDAEVPSQWCVCEVSIPLDLNDESAVSIAKFLVTHINDNILKKFSSCERLSLDQIIYARKAHTGSMDMKKNEYQNDIFTIGFKVEPSKALFEGTVIKAKNGITSHSLTLSDTIGRLQLYRNESLCITDHFVQMYCYCSDLLKNKVHK